MSHVPILKLNNGLDFPSVGLGCWLGTPAKGENPETYQMVKDALKLGYRHIDTAFGYGNEEAVGHGIRDSGIPREEIFVVTKLTGKHHGSVSEGFNASLSALNIGYIDLYLMHWPQAEDPATGKTVPYGQSPTFNETWKEMEKLLEGGKCKAIGVSNFSVKTLEILAKDAKVVPAVNQVEAHPYLPNAALHDYCKEKGIVLTAYSPLGQPREGTRASPLLTEPVVKKLAEKYGKPAGTILMSWGIQRGNWSVIPKSSNVDRLKANLEIITLDEADFEELSQVHNEPGKLLHLCDYGADIMKTGKIAGWTLEEMGWSPLD